MVTRRNFLKSSAAALPELALQKKAGFPAAPQPLGVQLYTVRKIVEANLPTLLKQIQSIGYQQVETFTGLYTQPAPELRHMIDDAGLSVPSGHFDYNGFAEKLDYAKQLGVNWMVCPALPQSNRSSWEGFRDAAKQFNQWGKQCRDLGMRFAFHNHDFEFKSMNGKPGYDVLLQESDPDLVFYEMDCYWVAQAGLDPVEMLKRLGRRVRMLHLKDRLPGFPPSNDTGPSSAHFTEVGHGNIDWKAILDTAQHLNIEYYFVEQDQTPGDPITSIRSSFQYLRTLMS